MISADNRKFAVVLAPALLVLVLVATVSLVFQVDMRLITRDVSAIGKIHPLSGVLSSLGILLWCVAASVCAFAAILARHFGRASDARFLLASALLSGYLLLDDLFLFHEELASRYLGLGEKVVFAALGVAVFAYLFAWRQRIRETGYGFLLLALAFLSLSVVIDTILEPWLWRLGYWEYFVEDGFKWLGIVSWCAYYVSTSFTLTVQAASGRDTIPPGH